MKEEAIMMLENNMSRIVEFAKASEQRFKKFRLIAMVCNSMKFLELEIM
jgi:hypothetical protein